MPNRSRRSKSRSARRGTRARSRSAKAMRRRSGSKRRYRSTQTNTVEAVRMAQDGFETGHVHIKFSDEEDAEHYLKSPYAQQVRIVAKDEGKPFQLTNEGYKGPAISVGALKYLYLTQMGLFNQVYKEEQAHSEEKRQKERRRSRSRARSQRRRSRRTHS